MYFLNRNFYEITRSLTKRFTTRIKINNSCGNFTDNLIETIPREINSNLTKKNRIDGYWVNYSKPNGGRKFCTIQNSVNLVSKAEHQYFMQVFQDIVRDLTDSDANSDIPHVYNHFSKCLQYNILDGKKNRGLSVVLAYKMLEKPENLTPENIRLANVLGWCVEMLLNAYLILDDVIDQAENRRGRLCWYKNNDIRLTAIIDGIHLEHSVYAILRQHFSMHSSYVSILNHFHDIAMKTTFGQSLDNLSIQNGKPNFDIFNMRTCKSIARYKTAYISYHLPVGLAMHLANFNNPQLYQEVETILMEIGEFFQAQDDFLDGFGNPAFTGKIGTDIKEGKCSWLAVVALERANSNQKKIIKENYGKNNAESINIIRNLYEELNLRKIYNDYQENAFNNICIRIQNMSKELPQNLFLKLFMKIYKRHY